jgi:hypothetical protein
VGNAILARTITFLPCNAASLSDHWFAKWRLDDDMLPAGSGAISGASKHQRLGAPKG